ncbi:hypothetical protein LOK49_LG03G03584 [Camellia lanceoleosa]|uniref:Uncharacterized protein n=1 Tax=Camellia lanceoleosa TaxID=1840588 RepID=A0ACC0IDA3_9ERIC|nr:hypothetical protein LOK49_LG03G03584 [Camellia lanceoleosa]
MILGTESSAAPAGSRRGSDCWKMDEVKASMENEVLTVTVPKVEVRNPDVKSIEISVKLHLLETRSNPKPACLAHNDNATRPKKGCGGRHLGRRSSGGWKPGSNVSVQTSTRLAPKRP